jgi:protein SCO1
MKNPVSLTLSPTDVGERGVRFLHFATGVGERGLRFLHSPACGRGAGGEGSYLPSPARGRGIKGEAAFSPLPPAGEGLGERGFCRWVLTCFLLLWGLLSPAAMAAPPLPSDSLYQLATPLVTQDGKPARLDLYRGHPTLITMFYGSCPHVCPTLIAALRRMERMLSPAERGRLRVLLISIDPERDTPEALRELAMRHSADLSRWTFARTSAPEVRKLAAALGIQYRKLPDGEFNHATVITLLDPDGRSLARSSAITRPDDDFLQTLRGATMLPREP